MAGVCSLTLKNAPTLFQIYYKNAISLFPSHVDVSSAVGTGKV